MPDLYLSRNILLVSSGLEEKQSFWLPSEASSLKPPLSAVLISMEFNSSSSPLLLPPPPMFVHWKACSIYYQGGERPHLFRKRATPSFSLGGGVSFSFKGRNHIPFALLMGAARVNLGESKCPWPVLAFSPPPPPSLMHGHGHPASEPAWKR